MVKLPLKAQSLALAGLMICGTASSALANSAYRYTKKVNGTEIETCYKINEYVPNYALNGVIPRNDPFAPPAYKYEDAQHTVEYIPRCLADGFNAVDSIVVKEEDLKGYKSSKPHKYTVHPRDSRQRIEIFTSVYDQARNEIIPVDASFKYDAKNKLVGSLVVGTIPSGSLEGTKVRKNSLVAEKVRNEVITALNMSDYAVKKAQEGFYESQTCHTTTQVDMMSFDPESPYKNKMGRYAEIVTEFRFATFGKDTPAYLYYVIDNIGNRHKIDFDKTIEKNDQVLSKEYPRFGALPDEKRLPVVQKMTALMFLGMEEATNDGITPKKGITNTGNANLFNVEVIMGIPGAKGFTRPQLRTKWSEELATALSHLPKGSFSKTPMADSALNSALKYTY